MAYQYPMGGDRQIIIVKEAQEIPYKNKENDEKAIIKYAKNPAPFTILVFAHKKSELDGKKKALNEALKPYLFLSEPIKKITDGSPNVLIYSFLSGFSL